MNRYTHSDWVRLGDAISRARRAEGFTDTQQWCEIVGRSDRQLLGLERGERVGRGTLRLVEDALDWPAGQAFKILDGDTAVQPVPVPASIREASDEQLLAELARRLADTTESEATSDGAPIATQPNVRISREGERHVLDVEPRTQRSRATAKRDLSD